MKFRNFIIVLLAVLMVFALASCKHEPEAKPTPAPEPEEEIYSESLIYKLTATKGRNMGWWECDKFVLSFSEKAKKNDVLTLKFRSTREITQFNIRGTDKWVYEQPSASNGPLPEGFLSAPDADGWITLTYTFGDKWFAKPGKVGADIDYGEAGLTFRVDFIGEIVTTDVLEVKDIKLNDTPLTLTKAKVSDSSAYGNVMPTYEETHVANWQESSDWVVFYFEGEPGEVDKTPEYERVFDGMTITRDWAKGYAAAEEHYSLKLLTGYDHKSAEFDPKTPIKENTRLYILYVGDPQKVTFNTDGGSDVAEQTVEYGTYATKPAEDPTKESGDLFAGWYVGDTPFDFEKTVITADTVITAHWGAPSVVTFDTQVDTIDDFTRTVPAGTPVKDPGTLTREGYRFDGWFTASTCLPAEKFDFATPITGAKTLYAGWTEAKTVTFNPNYANAPEAEVAYVIEGEKVAEPTTVLMRAGYVFAGWYTEAECTNKYNFDTAVDENKVLYAKWTTGIMSRLVITRGTMEDGDENSDDKFILTFQNDANAKVKAGDVLSISFRSNRTFAQYTIRGDAKWFHEKVQGKDTYPQFFKTFETGADGWTTVTYDFPTEGTQEAITYGDTGTWFRVFFRLQSLVKGDILEVRAITLNGKELVLSESNVGEHGAPTFETNLEDYEWTAHTVSFEVGEGVTPIDSISVPFCSTVELPADPEKANNAFAGWFTDAECTEEFDESTLIRENITLYAKFIEAEKRTVTFNLNYAEAPAPTTANTYDGLPIAKPADPTRAGYLFDGWTVAAAADSDAYDFTAPVTGGNLEIFAQWTASVTVTLNLKDEGSTTKTYVFRTGEKIPTIQVNNTGKVLEGWYEAEDLSGSKFDVTTETISADKILYAKWVDPEHSYKLTATQGNTDLSEGEGDFYNLDKFAVTFSKTDVLVNPGDILAFQYKFENEGGREYKYFSIRGAKKWFSEKAYDATKYPQSLSSRDDIGEGWYSCTYVFPALDAAVADKGKITANAYFRLDIRAASGWCGVGDIIYIKAITLNGQEIEIDTSVSDFGKYAKPSLVDLNATP